MENEPNPMKEIHEIKARFHEEQKCRTEKEKLESLHNETEETIKRLKLKKRVNSISDVTSV